MVGTAPAVSENPLAASQLQQPALALGSVDLSDGERRTLRRALVVIRAARAALNSSDPKAAVAAKFRLRLALHYVAGFLDGKGLISTGLNPGFASIFEAALAPRDLAATLDDLEKSLEDLLDPTRGLAGAALIAIGVGLKVLGEWLQQE